MECHSYKEFMEKRDKLRNRLWRFMMMEHLSVLEASKWMKISPITLKNFLIEKKVKMKTLMKISNWLDENNFETGAKDWLREWHDWLADRGEIKE